MIRTKSPFACRIPVFTAAPFPLLYGCRTTQAPAARALADVSSLEPSSTTRLSRHRVAVRREDTTVPMASASFIAGMTIESLEGSAKQLLDHTVPRDRLRDVPPRAAEPLGDRPVGRESLDRRGKRRDVRLADESIDAISYELEWTSRIGRGDHGFGGQKRFQRHVSVVFVEWRVYHPQRAGVQICHRIAPQCSRKGHAIAQVQDRGLALELSPQRSISDDDK